MVICVQYQTVGKGYSVKGRDLGKFDQEVVCP